MGDTEKQKIKKYFESREFVNRVIGIAERHGIQNAAEYEKILVEVAAGTLRPSAIAFALTERCGIPESAAYPIHDEIVELLDPIEDIIGTQSAQVTLNLSGQLASLDSLEKEINQTMSAVKSSAGITIREDVLERRFRNVVFNWIRDVRDDMETKDTAVRETRVGGLGFTLEVAERFIQSLRQIRENYKGQGKDLQKIVSEYVRRKEELFTKKEVEDVEIDVPKGTADKQQFPPTGGKKPATIELAREILRAEKVLETRKELEPPKPMIQKAAPAVTQPPIKKQEMVIKGQLTKAAPPQVQKMVASAAKNIPESITSARPQPAPAKIIQEQTIKPANRQTGQQPVRPKVADVKIPPKLYGPVEELASLTVADFRRLSADPEEAARKIYYKLDLLGQESLTKRAAGAAALKGSPLYAAYAAVMQQSIAQGKPFAEVIGRQSDITLAELNAILKLNKTLLK